MVTPARGALRTPRERIVQTLWFEGIGLLVVAPLYGWATGTGLTDSLALVGALSLVVMAWAALFNTVFDRAEMHFTGRVASDRPHRLRLMHALLFEASAAVVSCPMIVLMTGMGWLDALLTDIALTLAYSAYGYLFHWAFDRLRPVHRHAG